jgi:hypothetical protein
MILKKGADILRKKFGMLQNHFNAFFHLAIDYLGIYLIKILLGLTNFPMAINIGLSFFHNQRNFHRCADLKTNFISLN